MQRIPFDPFARLSLGAVSFHAAVLCESRGAILFFWARHALLFSRLSKK